MNFIGDSKVAAHLDIAGPARKNDETTGVCVD